MDTGVGKEGYSIIGQGRIDEILSTKSEDRRMVFEEAAGIVKYKARKEEAEKKLEQTRQNILRIEDIIEELYSQLEPLKEQSEVAKTYLNLREELKRLEINLFIYDYDRIKERINQVKLVLDSLQEQYHMNSSRLVEMEKESQAEEELLFNLEKDMELLQQEILNLITTIEKYEGESKVVQERKQNIEKDSERLQQEIKSDNDQLHELETEQGLILQKIKHKEALLVAVQQELSNFEAEMNVLSRKILQGQENMEKHKGSIIDALNFLSDIKSRLSHFNTLKSSVEKRLTELDALYNNGRMEMAALEKDRGETTSTIASKELERKKYCGEKLQLEGELNKIKQDTQRLDQRQQEIREKIHTLTSRLHMLEEMRRDYDGFQNSVKHILKDSQRNFQLKQKICGVVAQLITVPAYIEKAVELALGGSLQNIVTETEEDAKFIIEYLRKQNYGRATFLPLSSIRSKTLNEYERASLKVTGCVGIASELISYQEKYREIIEYLLGRTVIVENLDAGIAIAKSNRHSFRIVTIEGDMINPGGSMTGGSIQSKYNSLLGRQREIDETRKQLEKFNKDHIAVNSSYQKSQERIGILEDQIKSLDEKIHDVDIFLTMARERMRKISEDIKTRQRHLDNVVSEIRQLKHDYEDINESILKMVNQQQKIESENVATQESLMKYQEQYSQFQMDKEKLAEIITQARIRQTSLEKECSQFNDELRRIQREISKLKNNICSMEQKLERNHEEISQWECEHGNLVRNIQQGKEILAKKNESIRELEEKKAKVQLSLKDREKEKKDLQKDIEAMVEKRHKTEMQMAKLEADLENIQNRIWDEYGLSYLNALPYRDESLSPNRMAGEIDRVKKEIRELGTVNVNAIEEYKRVSERYNFLCIQKNDLVQAENHLQGIIEELLITMREKFQEQFAVINRNFNKVFQKLFGGGRAELVLQNGQDILECGIDIIAQPPGKKLQNLTLLSGGERALTAIAILFAILELKPTPFCLLDEIDAALDEANVHNFAQYLNEYAASTQFVVITHRKGTMEVCDALFGMAMEEKGISRLVSVRLEEKEKVS